MGFFVKGCITSAVKLIKNYNPVYSKKQDLQNCHPVQCLVWCRYYLIRIGILHNIKQQLQYPLYYSLTIIYFRKIFYQMVWITNDQLTDNDTGFWPQILNLQTRLNMTDF